MRPRQPSRSPAATSADCPDTPANMQRQTIKAATRSRLTHRPSDTVVLEVAPAYPSGRPGTYELFRHFCALPSARDRDGREVAAARGVLASVLGMIKGGATLVALATDQVIEFFATISGWVTRPAMALILIFGRSFRCSKRPSLRLASLFGRW